MKLRYSSLRRIFATNYTVCSVLSNFLEISKCWRDLCSSSYYKALVYHIISILFNAEGIPLNMISLYKIRVCSAKFYHHPSYSARDTRVLLANFKFAVSWCWFALCIANNYIDEGPVNANDVLVLVLVIPKLIHCEITWRLITLWSALLSVLWLTLHYFWTLFVHER